MKKVCVVAPVHHNRDVRIFTKQIRTLIEYNYQVSLISRIKKDDDNDQFEHKNYQEISVPNYKNRLHRLLILPWLVTKCIKEKADIYHIHNPDTLPLGFILKVLRKKVIYDTHEDFSQRILMREYLPKSTRRILAKIIANLENGACKYFDACIVTQTKILDRMNNAYLIENAPTHNSNINQMAVEYSKSINKENECYYLIYVGGISRARGIIEILDTLLEINKQFTCRLWLIGPFMDNKIEQALKKHDGWKYVNYLGEKPQYKAFGYIIKADVGLVTILDEGDHKDTSPNKLFEYQMFSLPFIASNFKEWTNKLKHIKSGLFINPESIDEMYSAIVYLKNNPEECLRMGKKGREYIEKEFNWNIESRKLINLYKENLEKESGN